MAFYRRDRGQTNAARSAGILPYPRSGGQDGHTTSRTLLTTAVAAMVFTVAATSFSAEKQPPAHPVNVNTATVDQLQQLPGIGASTARAIVRHRERNGPFRRLEELLIIRGISRARLRRLRPYLRL